MTTPPHRRSVSDLRRNFSRGAASDIESVASIPPHRVQKRSKSMDPALVRVQSDEVASLCHPISFFQKVIRQCGGRETVDDEVTVTPTIKTRLTERTRTSEYDYNLTGGAKAVKKGKPSTLINPKHRSSPKLIPIATAPTEFTYAHGDGMFNSSGSSTESSKDTLIPPPVGSLHINHRRSRSISPSKKKSDGRRRSASENPPHSPLRTRTSPDFLPVPPPQDVSTMAVPVFPHVQTNESSLYTQIRTSKELQPLVSGLECTVKRIGGKGPYNDAWSEPHAGGFHVRGSSYLSKGIGKGIKRPSKPSLFSIVGVDSTKNESREATRVAIMSASEESYRHRFASAFMLENALREAKRNKLLPQQFLLMFNFVLPWGNLVIHTMRDQDSSEGGAAALWERFLDGSESYRMERLKMLPAVKKGPYLVKKLVGQKPVIIANKIPVAFSGSRELNYLEISLDVSKGGAFANSIAHSVMGKADLLEVDLAFVIEAKEVSELPEQILAVVRLHKLDMRKAPTLEGWKAHTVNLFAGRGDEEGVHTLGGSGGSSGSMTNDWKVMDI